MAGEHVRSDAAGAEDGFLTGLSRRWRWIAGGTLAALVAAGLLVLAIPQRYVAVATVSLGAARDEGAAGSDSLAVAELARAAVDRLRLASNPEFASGGNAVDEARSHLRLAPAAESRTLTVTFVSRDPALAAEGANTVAGLAADALNAARAKSDLAVETALAGKIRDAKARVAAADARVAAFRAESGGDGQGMDAAGAGDLDARLAAARARATSSADAAALLRKLARDGRLADAPPAIVGETLRRLLDRRIALKAQIADASRTLLPLHPRMKDLAAQLAALDGEIRAAADDAARAEDAEARRAGDEANALAAALAERSKAAAAAASGTAATLRALEAEAQTARDSLAAVQEAAREAANRAAAAAGAGGARILERATPPRAADAPKLAPILFLGAAAGFALSSVAAAFAAFLATRRRANAPERRSASAAPAASVVSVARETAAVAETFEDLAPRSAAPTGALDSVAALAASLERLKPEGALVALVTGDRSGQALGAALETARRLSTQRAVVLVDLGRSQDWLGDILYRDEREDPAIPGLADLIAGRAGFGDVIRRDLSSSLDVVLPGAGRPTGSIDDALAAFAAAYGAVILHASDWRSPWARAAAEAADAVVAVAPAARVGAVLDAARRALGDACPTILAHAVRAPETTLDRAA